VLTGVADSDFDIGIRNKFSKLISYRLNRRLASYAWVLLQNNLKNVELRKLCSELELAWAGRKYAAVLQAAQVKYLPSENKMKLWLNGLTSSCDQDSIPVWVRTLSEATKIHGSETSTGFNQLICQYLYNAYRTPKEEMPVFADFMTSYLLKGRSQLMYELLNHICSDQQDQSFAKTEAVLISEHIIPLNSESLRLLEAYLILLEPVQYDTKLCLSIVQDEELMDLADQLLDSTTLDKLYGWQQIWLAKTCLAGNKYKLESISKYFDLMKKVEVYSDADKKALLIYFTNIVMYDDSRTLEELIVFPLVLFDTGKQALEFFDQIEARQAVLDDETQLRYSDSLIESVRAGNGSQALRLMFSKGASLLYANEVLSDLLG
jgi:hypothetical protein